jgi:glutaredoxin 3
MGLFFDKPAATATDSSSYDQFIKRLVTEHPVVVFSKTSCGYCTRAKAILDERQLKYHSIELDVNSNCPNDNCTQLIKSLMLQTRMRTVPQIFINGKLIGGCSDLETVAAKNEKLLGSLPKKETASSTS